MKILKKSILFFCLTSLICCIGCSTNMFKGGVGGAATGALGTSFVGAMTDLILDGKVNADRLARNATSGAIAGGMAGAAVGHSRDVKEEAAAKKKAEAEFKARVGRENYSALTDLVNCRHATAYRKATEAAKSRKQSVKEAAYVIQALVDTDLGDMAQAQAALNQFIDIQRETSKAEAKKGLKELMKVLQDERKQQGISCD